MSDLCTRPLSASARELLQEDTIDIGGALLSTFIAQPHSAIFLEFALQRRGLFVNGVLMRSLLAEAIWESA